MTELLKTIILAFVQGIAEFLPISSSGHLAVIGSILDSFCNMKLSADEDSLNNLTLNVVLHIGTLFSLLIYYFKTLLNIVFKLRIKLALLLILASIPAAVAGVLFHDFFENVLSNLWVIGGMFILTAILLISSQIVALRRESNKQLSDKTNIQNSNSAEAIVSELNNITWFQAFTIGCFQMVAILPGLSRSGSTIAGGLFSGLKQSAAANFSFLMAIPVIGGAGLLELVKLLKKGVENVPVTELSIGFGVSFVVGLLSLYWVIEWIKKGKLNWFAYWVIAMAVVAFTMALQSA